MIERRPIESERSKSCCRSTKEECCSRSLLLDCKRRGNGSKGEVIQIIITRGFLKDGTDTVGVEKEKEEKDIPLE